MTLITAHLRLPSSISSQARAQLVEGLLEDLGLSHCADSLIGSAAVRGVSGGEKRRVAIGVELVVSPSTIFLDEPTSGLDSFNAEKVVKILAGLAANGCSVLCTIHQPSTSVFELFDNTILLKDGSCVYNGPTLQVPEVFSDAGCTLSILLDS